MTDIPLPFETTTPDDAIVTLTAGQWRQLLRRHDDVMRRLDRIGALVEELGDAIFLTHPQAVKH